MNEFYEDFKIKFINNLKAELQKRYDTYFENLIKNDATYLKLKTEFFKNPKNLENEKLLNDYVDKNITPKIPENLKNFNNANLGVKEITIKIKFALSYCPNYANIKKVNINDKEYITLKTKALNRIFNLREKIVYIDYPKYTKEIQNDIILNSIKNADQIFRISSSELLCIIENTAFKNDEESINKYIKFLKSDILIITNLGSEIRLKSIGDVHYKISSKLYNLINTRFENNKQTVLITNVSPIHYSKIYSILEFDNLLEHIYPILEEN